MSYPPALSSTSGSRSHSITEKEPRETLLGIELLSFDEIDDLSREVRERYLRRLFEAELDAAVPEGRSHYRSYRRHTNCCTQVLDEITGETCTKQRWQHHVHCLKHLSAEDLDTRTVAERRSEETRARMAELLEVATDKLEGILRAEDDEIAPSIRMKAIELLYDRSGVPKLTQSDVRVEADVTHHTDNMDVITARLDRLGEEFITEEVEDAELAALEGSVDDEEGDTAA